MDAMGAEFNGALEVGAEEGVVHDHCDLAIIRDGGDGGDA